MELWQVLELCKAYRGLGDAVADQLLAVVGDDSEETLSAQNGNALVMCADWLDQYATAVSVDNPEASQEARDLSDRLHEWVGR